MGRGIADSLLKATSNYDEPPYSASPNLKEAVVALPSFQPLCHKCFDHPRRWKQYWATSLLRESRSKGCWDLLPEIRKSILGNSIHITKVASLLSGLWDMVDDEIPRNQGFASTANPFWEDILMVVTTVIIWFERGNAQGNKESGYSRFTSAILGGRGILARWWNFRRSSRREVIEE